MHIRHGLQIVFTLLCLFCVANNITFIYASYTNYASISRTYQLILVLMMCVSSGACLTYMCTRATVDKRSAVEFIQAAKVDLRANCLTATTCFDGK
jgi:hypothetical protein